MIPLRDNIPHRNPPIVTVSLIVVNILVFLYQLTQGSAIHWFVMQFGFVPERVFTDVSMAGKFFPLVSNMFVHGGFFHLLGNCWYLWIFADNVEDRLGHGRFLVFYILCGLVANLVHFIFNIHSPVPAIGASGAVAGVLGAYFVLFPQAKVLTFVPIFFFWQVIQVPAFFFLGLWFVYQLFSGVLSIGFASGIAFWAHIGGFVAGFLYLRKSQIASYV